MRALDAPGPRHEAAQAIGVSRSRLYELLATGEIPGRKLGKATVILRDDLERYIAGLPEWEAAS